MNLTKRESDVVIFIKEFIEDFGYPPTYRDIADGLFLSSIYSVQRHVMNLVAKGYLEIVPKAHRSFKIVS